MDISIASRVPYLQHALRRSARTRAASARGPHHHGVQHQPYATAFGTASAKRPESLIRVRSDKSQRGRRAGAAVARVSFIKSPISRPYLAHISPISRPYLRGCPRGRRDRSDDSREQSRACERSRSIARMRSRACVTIARMRFARAIARMRAIAFNRASNRAHASARRRVCAAPSESSLCTVHGLDAAT